MSRVRRVRDLGSVRGPARPGHVVGRRDLLRAAPVGVQNPDRSFLLEGGDW